MPSAVISAISSFRQAIDSHQQAESLRMAQAWLAVSRGLDQEFEALARDIGNAAAAGRGTSLWHISRMDRYQTLRAQIIMQQRQYATVAADEVAQTQALLGRWAIVQSEQLVTMQQPAVAGTFDRLPVEAVTNMVGNAGDGTPLGSLLRNSFADQGTDVGNVLVRGTALGWNPVKVARAMRDVVNITLDRAITISRTETARVYRTASLETYRNSGIVESWIWKASLSTRTCAACLSMDGSVHPMDEDFASHVLCRCTPLPKISGVSAPQFETGEEWFGRQDAVIQRRILGPGRYDLWSRGKVDFSQMATTRHSHRWGDSIAVTPIQELTA